MPTPAVSGGVHRGPWPATGAAVRSPLSGSFARMVALVLACAGGFGCRSSTARRAPLYTTDLGRAYGAPLALRWRLALSQPRLFEAPGEECATGVVAGKVLVLGQRSGRVIGVDLDAARVVWSRPVGAGIDSEAVFHAGAGLVLVGADDGTLLALRPANGARVWAFRGEGAIERAPAVDDGRIFFSTAHDKLYALEVKSGRPIWTYDRDKPDGFTIHGHSAAVVSGDLVFMGFSDGFLVALRAESGDVAWARSLALAASQYVDVDSTPVVMNDLVIAASQTGGVYALDRQDGEVRWRLPIEGASVQVLAEDRLYFFAPRGGLHAVDARTGEIVWRNGLERASDITIPRIHGPLMLFSSTRAGLYVLDRENGRLLQVWNPGRGLCAGPAIDAQRGMTYVLSNGGSLYALALSP